ncbi:MAG: helix-turn-helix transcriptional regulator [Oscillospiraceae bacterium]|nr:helix-turn-helix transcriptional regulator [Oscillospiraceae bacterium]
MGKNFRETLKRQLENDADLRKEYEALYPEYELAKMLISCRSRGNLTQKQLSELTGIDQADISKIENGNANPSIKTLTRIASAMNMTLKIEFVPNAHNV